MVKNAVPIQPGQRIKLEGSHSAFESVCDSYPSQRGAIKLCVDVEMTAAGSLEALFEEFQKAARRKSALCGNVRRARCVYRGSR